MITRTGTRKMYILLGVGGEKLPYIPFYLPNSIGVATINTEFVRTLSNLDSPKTLKTFDPTGWEWC